VARRALRISSRRLREHGLGVLDIAFFELAAPLKAEHDGISILAILSHGGMELSHFLEAGELVEDEPDGLGWVQLKEKQKVGILVETEGYSNG